MMNHMYNETLKTAVAKKQTNTIKRKEVFISSKSRTKNIGKKKEKNIR